jgi:hypothetical protein
MVKDAFADVEPAAREELEAAIDRSARIAEETAPAQVSKENLLTEAQIRQVSAAPLARRLQVPHGSRAESA